MIERLLIISEVERDIKTRVEAGLWAILNSSLYARTFNIIIRNMMNMGDS